MKQYCVSFMYGLLGLLLAACTNTDFEGETSVVEGIPVVARLSFSIPDVDKVETRAFDDDKVGTIYMFAFKPDGSFITGNKHDVNSGAGTIEFQTLTGPQLIYAVANPSNDMFQGEIVEKLNDYAAKGCRQDDLSGLIVSFKEEAINFGNSTMVMSGVWKDGSGTTCTIGKEGNPTTEGKIELKRAGSKINFGITSGKDITFTLESYQVCDVPSGVPLFDDFATGEAMPYFSSKKIPNSSKNGFSFYMLENKATATTCNSADDREKLSEGSLRGEPKDRIFANVGNPATYVLLHGSYKGPSKSQKQHVEAQVTYCIHLGKGAGAGADYNDFTTERNSIYTYKLTVEGVDNIIAEVIQEGPDFPREEGDVIISGSKEMIRCDAHFEARLITFNKSDLIEKNNFTFIVKDPSTGNQYVKSEDITSESTVNLDWVYFRYNKTVRSNKFKYPGEKALNSTEKTRLIKVDELVDELRLWTEEKSTLFDNTDEVELTAFVNEYYYQDRHWGDFVNTDDREMLIICKKQQQQNGNGNSTVTTDATYAIKQRSIKTVYNTADEELNAWGIESVNETGLLGWVNNPIQRSDASYGRPNMYMVVNKKYSTYINYSATPSNSDYNAMEYSYNNAYYACLQRNRDEDGDGKIEQKEIKWYLASGGQYVSLWMGKAALPVEASLFVVNFHEPGFSTMIPNKYHYTTSDGSDGRYVLWAEEGVTVGGDGTHVTGSGRNYRCVRDLNVKGDDEDRLKDIELKPELIYEASVKGDGVQVDLPNLNEHSVKQSPTIADELDKHHERDDQNMPYRSFMIAKDVSGRSDNWNTLANVSGQSVCPGGWRIPNQCELAFIYLIVKDGRYGSDVKGNFASETIFARSAYSGIAQNGYIGKHGYIYNAGGNISLVEKNGATGRIRCVSDVK